MGRVGTTDIATDITKGVPGVYLHGKSLRIEFSYRGVRCKETLGIPATKTNVKHAAGLLATVKHEIKLGTFNYVARFPNSKTAKKFGGSRLQQAISLEQLKSLYTKIKYIDLGPQTADRYTTALNECINTLGKDRFISSLMPDDISNLRAELVATRKPSTCNHYLATFRGLLEYAQQNEYTDKDLVSATKRFKIGRTTPDPLSIEEYNQIIEKGCRFETHKNLVTVALYTGMRTGELCALAWEDVDLQKGIINVCRNITKDREFKLPKTGEARIIKLLPPAVEALKAQKALTGLWPEVSITKITGPKESVTETVRSVFRPAAAAPYKDHRMSQEPFYRTSSANVLWKKLLTRAGVRVRNVYQTRHTYACWNLTAHGNIAFIAKQMGHTDYSMLVKVYGRWMEDASDSESEKIWNDLTNKGHFTPTVPQTNNARTSND